MVPVTFTNGDIFDSVEHYCVLSGWAYHWLINHVGHIYEDWDVRTFAESGSRDVIFFRRRKDALHFIRAINEQLTGVRNPHIIATAHEL